MSFYVDPQSYKDDFLTHLENSVRTPSNNSYCTLEKFKEVPPFLLASLFKENASLKDLKRTLSFYPFYHSTTAIIGAGGVTSWFLPQYIKSLHNMKVKTGDNTTSFIYLIDGDTVEEKNCLRQNFIPEDIGQKKAIVLAERYNLVYPGIQVIAIPKYYSSKRFVNEFVKDPEVYQNLSDTDNFFLDIDSLCVDIVINCLDNELSKHMIDYHLTRLGSKWYFSAGCYEHGGTITALNTSFDLFSLLYQDETFKEEGGDIITYSCAEQAEDATVEQTFDSNALAATTLNIVINNYMSDMFYSVKRVSFNSSGIPNLQVLEENVSLNYVRTKIILNCKLHEIYRYLRQRDFKFPKSAKSRAYLDFIETWSSYFDIKGLMETWDKTSYNHL